MEKEKKLKIEGECLYCKEIFAKAGITKHLTHHLAELQKQVAGSQNIAYHLRIEGGPYFLNILMNEDITMKRLDTFLRKIWLECCGHLSKFYEAGMAKKAGEVFDRTDKLGYEYDFGSTTTLYIKLLGTYQSEKNKEIILLSRNEPLLLICDNCKLNPSVSICTVCQDDDYNCLQFCSDCAKIHKKECADFDDYSEAPIVNSPRMGECAYEGGTIDVERDRLILPIK